MTRFPDEGRREKRERDKGEGGEGRYKAHCCATVAHCTKVSPKFANLRFLLECDKDAVKERHRIIFLPSILLLLFFFLPFLPPPQYSFRTPSSFSVPLRFFSLLHDDERIEEYLFIPIRRRARRN